MTGWIDIEHQPRAWGFYWLRDTYGMLILGHWGNDHVWRSCNAGGESFKLQDTYTHWTPVQEPQPWSSQN